VHPDVHLGDPVLWYEAGDKSGPAYPGFVTQLGNGTAVTVAVMEPNLHNLQVRDAVKYVGDKTIREDERVTSGAWDHHPRTLEAAELRKRLAELADAVSKLPRK